MLGGGGGGGEEKGGKVGRGGAGRGGKGGARREGEGAKFWFKGSVGCCRPETALDFGHPEAYIVQSQRSRNDISNNPAIQQMYKLWAV